MKQKLILWLLSLLIPRYTEEQKRRINMFKSMFKVHFEGFEDVVPDEPLPVYKLGVTNLEYQFVDNILHVDVTVEKPGLLIGKGGKTIDGLNTYLSGRDMRVHIKESNIWKYLK